MPQQGIENTSERSAIVGEKNEESFFGVRSIILTVLSALLVAFSIPGRPAPWLAWLAMIPLLFQLQLANTRQSFFLSGLFGWFIWFPSVWWLHAPLHDMLGMSIPAAIFLIMGGCLMMAAPYALAGAVIAKWKRKPGLLGSARDAAIFTLSITWLTPIFQGNLAHTQYQYPIFLQILEIGGTPLLLFFIFWVNTLLADAAMHFRNERNPWKPIIIAIAIFSALILYGAVRLQQFETAMKSASPEQRITIGAVQPNIPINTIEERRPAPDAKDNDFNTALQQAEDLAQKNPNIDLFVFPENPETFLFNQDTMKRQALGKLINEIKKPIMLNADAFDPAKASSGVTERYNVAILMDANRNLANSYAKIKRIPFIEYIPGESQFPWLRKWLPKTQRVLEGSNSVLFDVKPGIHVVPLICYEGTRSSFTRRFIQKGGNVIVNQVNDSWFLRTPASEVHLALTLFRSVEYRVPLVRVTNSGIGAHIQATGHIVSGSKTELFTRTETAFPLYVPAKRSAYSVIGNWWMLGFSVLLFYPHRKPHQPEPQPPRNRRSFS